MAIKDPTTSVRKYAYELKVNEKTMRPAIKKINLLDFVIWGVLENKMNATSYLNIGTLKTAIEKGWNKISDEFILKACKSFRSRVDMMIKNGGHIE